MKMTDKSYAANPAFTNKSTTARLRLVLRCACLTAVAVAMMLGGAGNCLASGSYFDFTWIAGSGSWQTGANWQTNFYSYFDTNLHTSTCRDTNFVDEVRSNLTVCAGGGTGTFPNNGFQGAFFTNAGTYTITISSSMTVSSNIFGNATNTESTYTFDLQNHVMEDFDAWTVGSKAGSTTTVTLVTGTGKILLHGGMTVGGGGHGTLYFNNGTIDNGTGSINLGTGDGGRGVLVVSGPNTYIKPNSQFSIGNDPGEDPAGSMLVISNGAHVESSSSFRVGSGSGKGGSSNNLVVIYENATLSCDSGPISIGVRSSGVTNSDGGTLCFNNVVLVKSGALWAAAITSTKSMCIGDAAWFGLSQSTTSTPPAICTGNLVRIEPFGVVTGISTLFIAPTNNLELLGGWLKANTISNWGQVTAYGLHQGAHRVFAGGKLKTLNSQGNSKGNGLVISNGLWMVTNSVLEVELGDTNYPTQIFFGGEYNGTGEARGGTNRFTIDGATLNIIDSGGFSNHSTYDLFTYATNAPTGGFGAWHVDATNALGLTNFTGFVIGKVPDTNLTYKIDLYTDSVGHVRLTLGGLVTTPFKIISFVRQVNNDLVLTWMGPSDKTYTVQSTPGLANGSYSNNFADLAGPITPTGTITAYTDLQGATNKPARYYRVKQN